MAPSPTIRRLLKETAELSAAASKPNPAFYAAPVSDNDLHEWHFTLLGPPEPSPYAGGLYHGRITLPSTYPLKPPNFRFLTPSGRFETNREICLSISGFHEETWMPAWGIRTALTALRTFMAEKGTAGQVGGLEAGKDVRERLAKESRLWRCEGCGSQGRTNEEVMEEWWTMCKERGIKVGEDGEEVGLELLPEGMNLEARDPNQAREQKSTGDSQENTPIAHAEDAPVAEMFSMNGANARPEEQDEASTVSIPEAMGLHEARQWVPTTSPASPSTHRQTQSTSSNAAHHAPATPSRTRTVEVITDPGNTTTIDRAIGVLVLALCLMILKKVFYPATTPYMEEYYMQDG